MCSILGYLTHLRETTRQRIHIASLYSQPQLSQLIYLWHSICVIFKLSSGICWRKFRSCSVVWQFGATFFNFFPSHGFICKLRYTSKFQGNGGRARETVIETGLTTSIQHGFRLWIDVPGICMYTFNWVLPRWSVWQREITRRCRKKRSPLFWEHPKRWKK